MLRIVHIANNGPASSGRNQRVSAKERFHRQAVEGLALRMIHDEKKAEKLFQPEMEELNQLKAKLNALRQMC